MPLTDSPQCRELLGHLFPTVDIESNLRPSGQRLVYFCRFRDSTPGTLQADWHQWGPVVLKISEDVHPTVIARLEKEREILNGLHSPFFPRLLYYDVFSSDPITDTRLPYRLFVTIEERIEGGPLTDCRAVFSREAAVSRLLLALVEGLTLLWDHPQRIVHRDLKPDNILIRPSGSPVIIDLGIIREQGMAGLTGSHWQMGPCTPAYASPEQLKNEKRFITYKSDFFSLGVLTYELLTGTNPFVTSAPEPLEVVAHRALTVQPPTLASLGLASPALSVLVERLMAKEPYKRPRTVRDLREVLQKIVGSDS
jgi:serine/threonine-protein kinase